MARRYWGILITLVGLTCVWLVWTRTTDTTSESVPVRSSIDVEVWRTVDRSLQERLFSGGYSIQMVESTKCRGIAAVKDSGHDQPWEVALAWWDVPTQTFTDIVHRAEVLHGLSRYVKVDRMAMFGFLSSDYGLPALFIGRSEATGEEISLQVDHNTCGVRRGWLEFTNPVTGERTKQPVDW